MVRKKTPKFNIQEIYNQGVAEGNVRKALMSVEFYEGLTSYIKRLLMKFLIPKGYYKNGIKQTQWDDEDLIDCYTYLMEKIIEKYDPCKGGLVTFIYRWVQGYSTIVVQKQARQHNKIGHILPLDLDLDNGISEEFKDKDHYAEIEEELDNTYFNNEAIREISEEEIKEFRKKWENID